MKIGVLTDSSSYLTKEQCEKYGIDVLPIPIIWDNKEYLDLIDIGFQEFYEKLSSSSTLPTTSQPSIGTVKKYVDKYIDAKINLDKVQDAYLELISGNTDKIKIVVKP